MKNKLIIIFSIVILVLLILIILVLTKLVKPNNKVTDSQKYSNNVTTNSTNSYEVEQSMKIGKYTFKDNMSYMVLGENNYFEHYFIVENEAKRNIGEYEIKGQDFNVYLSEQQLYTFDKSTNKKSEVPKQVIKYDISELCDVYEILNSESIKQVVVYGDLDNLTMDEYVYTFK